MTALVKAVCGESAEKIVDTLALFAFGSDKDIIAKFETTAVMNFGLRMDAIKELRNMGFGIPKQSVDVDVAPVTLQIELTDRVA